MGPDVGVAGGEVVVSHRCHHVEVHTWSSLAVSHSLLEYVLHM